MSVAISTTEGVTMRDQDKAIEKIEHLIQSIEARILHVDIRLTLDRDPARERPAHARAILDLNGSPVRAHVVATTIGEAIDLLDQRLRRRLETLAEHRQALRRRGLVSAPGEWRHGDLPTPRSPYFDRPAAEREVVRHKTFSTPDASLDEAVFDLESFDYDFYLFTDSVSGDDAVVWRRDEGGYQVRFAGGEPTAEALTTVADVQFDARPAPTLTIDEAREALDTTAVPWVFYVNSGGRARVLYRRYDGHYGLLTPAGDA